MKRIICLMLCLFSLFSLASCANTARPSATTAGTSNTTVPTTGISASESTGTTAPVTEETTALTVEPDLTASPIIGISLIPVEQQEYSSSDVLLFTHSYPEITVYAPDPNATVTIQENLNKIIEFSLVTAQGLLEMAEADYSTASNWTGYSYETQFSPERVDSTVLSLSGITWSYTGGVHPNNELFSLNYDAATGKLLTLEDLLTGEEAADALLQLVIEQLAADAAGLNANYQDIASEHFDFGSDLSNSYYLTQDGICFYFSTYEIAPYARGPVEIVIAYEDLDGLIKDTWFPAGTPAEGTVHPAFADSIDTNADTAIPLTVDASADTIAVQFDGAVTNLRITQGNFDTIGMERVLFAAGHMNSGYQIDLNIALSVDTSSECVISYQSGGEDYHYYLSLNEDQTPFLISFVK